MTQEERRRYPLDYLLSEEESYQDIPKPRNEKEERNLLRALMNVRLPKKIPEEFLTIQDAYLQEESRLRGIVDGMKLPAIPNEERTVLWQGDITTLKVDAIVNAANSALLGCFYPLHSCIDNLIHTRSGVQLRLYCADLMARQGHEEENGKAKITPAFNLPSRYILHTVGPIVRGRVTKEDERNLASCYRSCLELAKEKNLTSLAFCCISTGEFHFPNREAAKIAIQTVKEFLKENSLPTRILFDVFKDEDLEIYQELLEVGR